MPVSPVTSGGTSAGSWAAAAKPLTVIISSSSSASGARSALMRAHSSPSAARNSSGKPVCDILMSQPKARRRQPCAQAWTGPEPCPTLIHLVFWSAAAIRIPKFPALTVARGKRQKWRQIVKIFGSGGGAVCERYFCIEFSPVLVSGQAVPSRLNQPYPEGGQERMKARRFPLFLCGFPPELGGISADDAGPRQVGGTRFNL